MKIKLTRITVALDAETHQFYANQAQTERRSMSSHVGLMLKRDALMQGAAPLPQSAVAPRKVAATLPQVTAPVAQVRARPEDCPDDTLKYCPPSDDVYSPDIAQPARKEPIPPMPPGLGFSPETWAALPAHIRNEDIASHNARELLKGVA